MQMEFSTYFKKYKYADVLALFILSRIAFLLIMIAASNSVGYICEMFDAINYRHIAANGYTDDRNAAFFPLLPILIRFLSKYVVLVINHVAFFGSLVLLKKLNCSNWILAILAFGPIGFFSMILYTESLFVFFTLSAFYLFSRKEKPLLMGILIGLSVLTRSTGALFFFAIFIGMTIDWITKKIKFKDIVVAYVPATILSLIFPVYLHFHYGNWKNFVDCQYTEWYKIHSNLWMTILTSLKMIFTDTYPFRSEIYKPFQILNEVISLIILFSLIAFVLIGTFRMIKKRELNIEKITLISYVLLVVIVINGTIFNPYLDAPTISFYRYYYSTIPLYLMLRNTNVITQKTAFVFTVLLGLISSFLFGCQFFFY